MASCDIEEIVTAIQNQAILNDNKELLSLLGNYSEDINLTFRKKTLLCYAVEAGSLETVRLLIERGADINSLSFIRSEHETALTTAARLRHTHIISALFLTGKVDTDKENELSLNALYWSCWKNNLEGVAILLQNGLDPNRRGSHCSRTHLHRSALGCHHRIIKILLENAADQWIEDRDGRLPIHFAAVFGNVKSTRHLIDQAAIERREKELVQRKDKDGMTSFILACRRGHIKELDLLMEFGALEYDSASADQLFNPLVEAAYYGKTGVVKYLIEHGLGVDSVDASDRTALTVACENKFYDLVLYLLEHESRLDIPSSFTPLQVALADHDLVLIKVLLRHGALLISRAGGNVSVYDRAVCEIILSSDCIPGSSVINMAEIGLPERPSVIAKLQTLPTLLDLCRARVRHVVMSVNRPISLLSKLHSLPLPQKIVTYLTFPEFEFLDCRGSTQSK